MNKVLFDFWLVNFLILEIKSGDVLTMDNATFHKSEEIKIIIRNASCELLYLPPYSPDLNLIQKYWANIKYFIRRGKHKFKCLAKCIDETFRLDRLKIN